MNSKILSWYTHHAEDARGDGFIECGLVLIPGTDLQRPHRRRRRLAARCLARRRLSEQLENAAALPRVASGYTYGMVSDGNKSTNRKVFL